MATCLACPLMLSSHGAAAVERAILCGCFPIRQDRLCGFRRAIQACLRRHRQPGMRTVRHGTGAGQSRHLHAQRSALVPECVGSRMGPATGSRPKAFKDWTKESSLPGFRSGERVSGRAGKIPSRNATPATSKVAQWVKVLPVKTDHLNSVLKTHTVKRPDSCKLWS